MFWESVYNLDTNEKISTVKNLERYEEASDNLKQFGKITHEKYDINKQHLLEFYRRATPGTSEYVDSFLNKYGDSLLLTTKAFSCTADGKPDYFYFGLNKNNYDYMDKFHDEIKLSKSLLSASTFVYIRTTLDGKFDCIYYEIYTDGFYETIMYNYFNFYNKRNCYENMAKLIKENRPRYFIYKNSGRQTIYVVEKEKNMSSFTGKIKLKSVSEKSASQL